MDIDFYLKNGFPYIVSKYDIIDNVQSIHTKYEDFDEGDIIERLSLFDKYILVKLSLKDIDLEEFDIDEDKIFQYVEKLRNGNIYPPIVYNNVNKSIIDGIHRINALYQIGEKHVIAYIGIV